MKIEPYSAGGQLLRDAIKEAGLSVHSVSRRLPMDRANLYKILRGEQRPSIERLRTLVDASQVKDPERVAAILTAFKYSPSEESQLAGVFPELDEWRDEVETIREAETAFEGWGLYDTNELIRMHLAADAIVEGWGMRSLDELNGFLIRIGLTALIPEVIDNILETTDEESPLRHDLALIALLITHPESLHAVFRDKPNQSIVNVVAEAIRRSDGLLIIYVVRAARSNRKRGSAWLKAILMQSIRLDKNRKIRGTLQYLSTDSDSLNQRERDLLIQARRKARKELRTERKVEQEEETKI